MIKTAEQYKKAILRHKILTGLTVLTLASGVVAGGVATHLYSKTQYSLIDNSQEYKDFYEQTQKDLLDSGEITEQTYDENIKAGPDNSINNYILYVNGHGTKEEIDKYYGLEKQRLYAITAAFGCAIALPVFLMYSHFSKKFIKDEFDKTKEEIELVDNNEVQI